MLRLTSILLFITILACNNKNEATLEDGHVIKKVYHENGELQAEVSYLNGKKDGLSKTYYESGQVRSEFNYVNGKKQGICRNYYREGSLSSEISYLDNKKSGDYTKYYKNGAKYTVSHYKDDVLDGNRTVYNRSGSTKSEMRYANGKPLPGTKRFKPNGELRDDNRILFKLDDKTALTGKAKLYIELEEKLKDAVYFMGTVDEEGQLRNGPNYPLPKDSKGRGYLEYRRPTNGMVIDKVEVVAIGKDRDQQVYHVSGVYNLVLD